MLRPILLTASVLLVSSGVVAGAREGAEPENVRTLQTYTLPDELRGIQDVRSAGADRVVLAVMRRGVLDWSLSEGGPAQTVIAGRGEPGGLRMTARLARTEDVLVAAGPVRELVWKELTSGELHRSFGAFDAIEDLDARGRRLLVVGVQRDASGAIAADGAIAWLAGLEDALVELRPILQSVSGAGARAMDNCGFSDLPKVRFLDDGRFVVIPGAEPGIYLFRADGTVAHTWESRELGLNVDCDLPQERVVLLSRFEEQRWERLNQFRIVDDVVPLGRGFGIVVRSFDDGEEVAGRGSEESPSRSSHTRWELVRLEPGKDAVHHDLPFTSPSSLAFLRADRFGDRLVFLISQRRPEGRTPTEATRLIVTSVPP